MKVLFAINNERISNAIIEKYKQLYNEELEYKDVYYYKALLSEVKKDKSYDRILIFEDFEEYVNDNQEAFDQYLFDKIDTLSDEVSSNTIIFVCQERRGESDKLLKRFVSLGIYSMLIGSDRTISEICKLIKKPRNKKDVKSYLNYGVEELYSRDNTVDEVEQQRIILYFKKLGDNTDKYIDSFERLSQQYNNMQMRIICNFLPANVKKYLNKNSAKYRSYINTKSDLKIEIIKDEEEKGTDEIVVEKPTGKKVLVTGKIDNKSKQTNGNKTEITKEINKEVTKEIIKEVPVDREIIKEVIKEVPVEKEVIKEVIKEVPVDREVIKEIIKEVPVIQEKEIETIRQVFEVPKDYCKTATFIGGSKVGTSFLINAIAYVLSKKGIKVAILDMTRERNMFYIYTQNNDRLRRKAENSISNVILNNDTSEGISINKNLTLFTSTPGTDRKSYNHMKLLERLKLEYKVILVDADFTTPIDYFRLTNDIYVVQDMDILTVQQITTFLRELKSKEISLAKVQVIINKFVKTSVTCKKLMEGLAYYYDPQMTFVDELLDPRMSYFTVPFNQDNYGKYINNLYFCDMDFSNFSKDFLDMIDIICNVIYPLNSSKGKMKPFKKGLFRR